MNDTPGDRLDFSRPLEDQILERVRKLKAVSLAEVLRWGGEEGRGHTAVEVEPNAILMTGFSERLAEAVVGLVRSKRVKVRGCSVLIYAIDGLMLNLPVRKRIPRKAPSKPVWIPAVLDPA